MKPQIQKSIEFLEWFRPGGPWVLSAIVPGGKITTSTFKSSQKDLLTKWIESRSGIENVYFQVNSSGDQILQKKATKESIATAHWLHVDVDPSADAELFEAERKRILKRIKDFAPKPSLVIDSGGGYQAFWKLDQPVKADDEGWSEFERYNKQIEADLGGDHCHNVDRIMRLPGTINVPNKKKRSLGRKEALSKVIYKEDLCYSLDTFTQSPMIDGGERGDVGRPEVKLSGNLPRLNEPDDLDQFGDVPGEVKMLIVQGLDPDRPDRYPSRSEAFWYVVCELVRCEIPDDVIAAVILDPDFLISGHVLDQKNPQGYAVRQIQRAKENAIHEDLPGFNDEHFVTFVGGKVKVVEEKYRAGRRELSFMDPGSFEKYYSNKFVVVGETKEGMPLTKKLGKWWVEHKHRRSYRGLVFDPSGDAPEDHYNLWRGFSCAALPGDKHESLLAHIENVICSGNEEHYEYLIKWVARMVQTPATQSETAIVLKGKEGTGKNTFVNAIASLFREHFFESSSSQQFLGNFNSHLRDKVLVHANEAFFAGDKKHEATLKMLITEATMPIEPKGVDIMMEPNYLHLIMSSNSEWVVPAGPESRRFMVLNVSDEKIQDAKYFAKIRDDMSNGGRENLLRYLLDIDLSGFNVRTVPITEALIDQRLRSMDSCAQWWYSRLERGYIINPEDGWIPEIETEHIWKSYIMEMREQGQHYNKSRPELGKFLNDVIPGLGRKRIQKGNSKRPYYMIADLQECRDHFDKTMGGPFEWDDLEAEVQGDIPF
jgi:thymidylate kinase